MSHGVGTYSINSFWESGRLIFYEKTVGHTTTGDVFIIGADYVQVGDTANDVNFVWDGTTTGTFTLDAGAHTLVMTGMATTITGGALTLGASGAGYDFKAHGATASAYVEWDASADRLNVVTVSGRAITGEEHAVDIVNGGTCSSGDMMVGLNVVTTASGTAASWVSGLFVKAVQASKVTNGYIGGAEIELQSTAANASDNSVLYLNSTRNHTGSAPASDPYITLREYGTTYADTFVRVFGDTGQGDTTTFNVNRLVTEVQDTYEANCRCAIRCMVGSTPMWLMGSTTAPTS